MTDDDLLVLAPFMYPASESMQTKWVASVKRLRSGRGWVADGAKGFALHNAEVPPVDPAKAAKVVPILKRRGK